MMENDGLAAVVVAAAAAAVGADDGSESAAESVVAVGDAVRAFAVPLYTHADLH